MKSILIAISIILLSATVLAESDGNFQLITTGAGHSAYLLNTKTGEVWFIVPKSSSGSYTTYKPESTFKYKVKSQLEEIFNYKGK
jgi:hypothetical protein